MTDQVWQPCSRASRGRLSKAEKDLLPSTAFAFPRTRKEPMTDAVHVRDAMARFNQVKEVTDSDRDLAFSDIKKAADYFKIRMKESDWHQFSGRV